MKNQDNIEIEPSEAWQLTLVKMKPLNEIVLEVGVEQKREIKIVTKKKVIIPLRAVKKKR